MNNTVDLDMLTGWTERFWTLCRSPTTSITNHSTSLAETYPCLLQHSRLSTDSENWQHSTITLPSSYRTQSSLFYLKMWIGLNLMHLVRLKSGKQSDGLIFSTRVPQLLGELWLAFLLLLFDMLPLYLTLAMSFCIAIISKYCFLISNDLILSQCWQNIRQCTYSHSPKLWNHPPCMRYL